MTASDAMCKVFSRKELLLLRGFTAELSPWAGAELTDQTIRIGLAFLGQF